MKKMLFRVICLVLCSLTLWLAPLCATAEPITASENTTAAKSVGVCYRVTGGKNDLFLLGSIHVGNETMYPMGEHILRALDAADTLVLECDTQSAEVMRQVVSMMSYPLGETLSNHISAEGYAQLEQVAKQLNYPIAAFNAMRPWAVVSMLALNTTAAEMSVADVNDAIALGVETQLLALTAHSGKAKVYLETAAEQLMVMDDFSPELQEYMLLTTCQTLLGTAEVTGMDEGIVDWPSWWRAGDHAAFADSYLLGMENDPRPSLMEEYHTGLVTRRNATMAAGLRVLLEGEEKHSYFATIGLLHLVLPGDSVVSELEKMGYAVEAVVE